MAQVKNVQHDFIEGDVLGRLAGLPLFARTPMLGSVSGRHRSPIRGSSLEFAEYRKYVPGDDTRRLDWRVWGRSDRFYIKEFEIEGRSKIQYARQLAGTLAYLAARQGDAVGLHCAGKGFNAEIPPRRSAAHLRVVLDQLAQMKAEGETGLPAALHDVAEAVPQRALIIIISDLFIEPATLSDCFQHLRYRKHDVAVFHLLDQIEIDFTFDRPTRFVDIEGGPPVMADPGLIGRQYRKAIQTYLEDLQGVLRDAAVDYSRICIDEPYGDVLARFLVGRTPKRKR